MFLVHPFQQRLLRGGGGEDDVEVRFHEGSAFFKVQKDVFDQMPPGILFVKGGEEQEVPHPFDFAAEEDEESEEDEERQKGALNLALKRTLLLDVLQVELKDVRKAVQATLEGNAQELAAVLEARYAEEDIKMFFEGKMSVDVLMNGCGAGTGNDDLCATMKGCAPVAGECLPEYHPLAVEAKNKRSP